MTVYTQGRITNPAAGTVLADTLAIDGGRYYPQVVVSSTVGAFVEFQVRDATNATNVYTQALGVPANGTVAFRYEGDCPVPDQGRYRIATIAAVTGQMHATVVW